MTKPTDIRIVEATCDFQAVAFRTPLKFGGRVIENSTLINVEVSVENRRGDFATGYGSMPIGNIWAWPSDKVSSDAAEAAMSQFARRVVELVESYPNFGHPIDIMFVISGLFASLYWSWGLGTRRRTPTGAGRRHARVGSTGRGQPRRCRSA